MCAIIGTPRLDEFQDFYKQALERGSFALGITFVCHNIETGKYCLKTRKFPDIVTQSVINELYDHYHHSYDILYILGHSQAPTSSVRKFSEKTTHPFICGNYGVAHNGVLENHIQLTQKYGLEKRVNDVDTSIIPALLNHGLVIEQIVMELKGTFALWITNAENPTKITLCRAGSTLYTGLNSDNRLRFFSYKTPLTPTVVEDGTTLHAWLLSHDIKKTTFQSNSPFFI